MLIKKLVPVNPTDVKQGDRVSLVGGPTDGFVTDASQACYGVLYVDWGFAGPSQTNGVQRVHISWVRSVVWEGR